MPSFEVAYTFRVRVVAATEAEATERSMETFRAWRSGRPLLHGIVLPAVDATLRALR